MRRKVPVQQIRYAHPHLLRKQYRNVVYAFGSYGKCIGHADKLTPISKARRKMGECYDLALQFVELTRSLPNQTCYGKGRAK